MCFRSFRNLVEGKELKHLMSCILQGEAETLETKWVRVLGPKEYTNTHSVIFKTLYNIASIFMKRIITNSANSLRIFILVGFP